MPIQVTCASCHKRFQVSDKFAGKSGPCPGCKATIKVPEKGDEVVIHAPEFGPKDAAGRSVLKPIEREETQLTPVMIVGIIGGVVGTLILALVLRMGYKDSEVPRLILSLGAVLVAPPVVLAGYSFLRNDELEAYRGMALAIRVLICAMVYAALWGGYALVKSFFLGGQQPELFHFVVIGPVFLAAGGVAALSCLDFDLGTGAIHYAFYLIVSTLLCWIVGAPIY